MPLIDPGERTPDFQLRDQRGGLHTLSTYDGRHVVLYFYPKDDTSGCTAEACAFRDALPTFEGVEAAVLGVSPDSESSHDKFARKHQLNFPLLADNPGSDGTPPVCAAFGVWQEKSMYGRKYMGVARTTYLIAPDGTVARRWDAVKVPGHAEEVLNAVKILMSGGALPHSATHPGEPAPAAKASKKSAKKSALPKPAAKPKAKAPAPKPAKKASKKAAKKAAKKAGKKSAKKAAARPAKKTRRS